MEALTWQRQEIWKISSWDCWHLTHLGSTEGVFFHKSEAVSPSRQAVQPKKEARDGKRGGVGVVLIDNLYERITAAPK